MRRAWKAPLFANKRSQTQLFPKLLYAFQPNLLLNYFNSMATQFVSAEFEVFGQVQGCYFTKYLKEQCEVLDIGGWVKPTKKETVFGIIQGTKANVDLMVMWLSKTGSPGSKIERCEMKNWANLARPEFKGFSVRF